MNPLPQRLWSRVSFPIPATLKRHISEFQFQNYIHSKGSAFRRLIRSGLRYERDQGNYHPKERLLSSQEEDESG